MLPKRSYYLRLTNFELYGCFAVWIAHCAYAWYSVWSIGDVYAPRLWDYGIGVGWQWPLGRPKDTTNFEWFVWTYMLPRYALALLAHAVTLPIVPKVLNDRWAPLVLSLKWLCFNCFAYGTYPVFIAVLYGILFYVVFVLIHRAAALWLMAVLVFMSLNSALYGKMGDKENYIFCIFVTYKLLQYMSFFLERMDDDYEASRGRVVDLLMYTLYMPYSTVLFVTYGKFRSQWSTRRSLNAKQWVGVGLLALRVAFWTFVADFMLYYFYMNAMLQDVAFLRTVSVDKVCAVVYTAGQYFHMKYVAIFGLFIVFAQVDGMKPANLPVCISRVALYSRIWRHFDHGLYSFLNMHIFRPLFSGSIGAQSNSSRVGRFVAGAACFLFVWLFHGQSKAFGIWSALNFLELMLELIGRRADRRWMLFNKSLDSIGSWNTRRLYAVCLMPCTVVSVFSIVFFLSGTESGLTVIDRLLIDTNFHVQPVFIYLCGLGYAFIHCCIEMEHLVPLGCDDIYEGQRKKVRTL